MIEVTDEPVVASQPQIEMVEADSPCVGVVAASKKDMETMHRAGKALEEHGIRYEERVMSAHTEPEKITEYARNAKMRGLRVIIAGAGLSVALPGIIAAHTELPVIAVPLSSKRSVAGGLDAVLSAVQMPPGVPVACVGLDAARNGALLALRMLDC